MEQIFSSVYLLKKAIVVLGRHFGPPCTLPTVVKRNKKKVINLYRKVS